MNGKNTTLITFILKKASNLFRKFVVAVALISSLISATCWAAPITSPFGWRVHPITGKWSFHSGTDIGYSYGDPVNAMLPGKVVYAAPWGGYGNCVILEHAGGDHTLYGHMSAIQCWYGEEVAKGQQLGLVGATGNATGPHLHLEWWHNGVYTDPIGLWNL